MYIILSELFFSQNLSYLNVISENYTIWKKSQTNNWHIYIITFMLKLYLLCREGIKCLKKTLHI